MVFEHSVFGSARVDLLIMSLGQLGTRSFETYLRLANISVQWAGVYVSTNPPAFGAPIGGGGDDPGRI